MSLTHEMGGLLIALMGVIFVVLASPLPRQAIRWHVHPIEQIEPAMLTWLARGIGFTLFVLGIVTLANTA